MKRVTLQHFGNSTLLVNCWGFFKIIFLVVLVLPGVELFFFPVADMEMCFGFVLEMVDNSDVSVTAEQCLKNQGLFCYSPQSTSAQKVGKGHSWVR